MAITASVLTANVDPADATSFTTASISPTGNALLLAAVLNRRGAGATLPTCSGNGLTWVEVTNHLLSSVRRLTVFRALGASPSAGAVTFDFGGNTQEVAMWSVSQFTGVVTTGTNGSGAIVQVPTPTTGTGTSGSVTLAALASANNMAWGAFHHTANQTKTVGSGFTILSNQSEGTGPLSLADEYQLNVTTVDMSWVTSTAWAAIAVEIAAASGGDTGGLLTGRLRGLVGGRLIR